LSIKLARRFRKQMSRAEARMWDYLRTLKADGFHFRRQVQLGPYYADFACHHAMLVIEIDGDTHYTPDGIEHDVRRDAYLFRRGFHVIRYTNTDVLQNMDGVATHLLSRLAEMPLRPGAVQTDQPSELSA